MRFKNLERYRLGGSNSNMQLNIPLPTTPDGRIYRYSPNEAAVPRHFLLGGVKANYDISDGARARMKVQPRSNSTVCPYSGVVAPDESFTHPDDVEAAHKIVEHAVMKDVDDQIGRMFKDLGRGISSKFLKVETKSHGYTKPAPRFARRDLLREIVCDHCGRDYGLYALGFFCPDCGAPNLRLHFLREVALVDEQVSIAESRDNEELAYRLLGNAHEDVLTAFETTLKAVYHFGHLANGTEPAKPVKNVFQNITTARQRFQELGLDPFGPLTQDAIAQLALNIQMRHVIGHNLGVVDAKFANLTGDARIGETIKLVGDDIRAFARLTAQVVDELDTWLGGGRAAPSPLPLLEALPEPMTAVDPKIEASTRLSIGPLAVGIGCWIVQQVDEGLSGMIDGDEIAAAFPDASEAEISLAVGELSLDQYIEVRSTMSSNIGYLTPTNAGYIEFDALAGLGDPKLTAASLLPKILAKPESVNVPELHLGSGYSKRTFNAGMTIILEQVKRGPISEMGTPDFPTRYFYISPEDRAALVRLQQELSG